MNALPAPPVGLSERGNAFWEATTEAYELSRGELELLAEACRTLDDLDALAASITRTGAMVTGSQGQPVVNPAIAEARGQRLALHRLLAALNLPDLDGSETIQSAHQIRSIAANSARWNREKRGA